MERDLYKITDYFIAITLIAIIFVSINKNSSKYIFIVPAIITVIVFFIQSIWGKTYCKNESEKDIFIKPEHGEEPEIVNPNNEIYDIDGIKVLGKVYKTCDGTHIIVDKNGNIKNTSIIGAVMNKIRGGYKEKAPAQDWEKLFQK